MHRAPRPTSTSLELGADNLFAVHASCPVQAPSWNRLVDVIGSYILKEIEPEGYVTAEKAAWLRERILERRPCQRKRRASPADELDRARALGAAEPRRFGAAGDQGHGGAWRRTARAGKVARGVSSSMPRSLFALRALHLCQRQQPSAFTRTEAEVLFETAAATSSSVPPSAWTELLVQAVANLAPGASAGFAASREAILKVVVGGSYLETPLEAQIRDILSSLHTDYHRQSVEERALASPRAPAHRDRYQRRARHGRQRLGRRAAAERPPPLGAWRRPSSPISAAKPSWPTIGRRRLPAATAGPHRPRKKVNAERSARAHAFGWAGSRPCVSSAPGSARAPHRPSLSRFTRASRLVQESP